MTVTVDSKLSALSSANALTGAETFYSDDGTNDVKVTADQLRTFLLAFAPTWVTLAGTDSVSSTQRGDVLVSVAGSVTLNLPSSLTRTLGPISVIDRGGNATSFPITINPFGSETIMGQSSVQITQNFGGWTLYPDTTNGGWYTK